MGEEKKHHLYAEVNVDIPAYSIDKPFHYIIPDKFREIIKPGMRVIVPFGPRKVEGYVLGFVDVPEVEAHELKVIEEILDSFPMLTQDLLNLSKWMAQRYVCTQAEVLRCILPTGIKFESVEVARVSEEQDYIDTNLQRAPKQAEILKLLRKKGGEMEVGEIGKVLGMRSPRGPLLGLQSKGFITLKREWRTPKVKPMMKKFAELIIDGNELVDEMEDLQRIAPAQARIAQTLIQTGGGPLNVADLLDASGASYSSLRGLEEKGIVICRDIEVERDPLAGTHVDMSPFLVPNEEQRASLRKIKEAIDVGTYETILIHGVTGSGKTEIYLQAIDHCIKNGKDAIVLVPEISLTPQMVRIFTSRFGKNLALLHSHLSYGERYDQWKKIRRGDVKIAIGARSAVFSPFENLGLIVIDEEHENSYKQSVVPRYHAREVAIQRAKETSSLVLLGSATPSLESYYAASNHDYTLISLGSRIDEKPMPAVEIIDMRAELKADNKSIFSSKLRQSIEERLANKEQIILFLNRRGHSTFVMCRECGYVLKCKHCDLSLTYHDREKLLRCHYCTYETFSPDVCPNCKGRYIKYLGIGTEKVENETRLAFPQASIMRMDSDTTTRKGSHQRILDAFGRGDVDILIGTQMIAKGLDFPNVTLVGVIIADTALHFPEFRSSERTFQLLTQVAGRSGRGMLPGEVIIQTYTPEHYSIVAAKTHNYNKFYEAEIIARRELAYPPFTHLANIIVSHRDEDKVYKYAYKLKDFIEVNEPPEDLVILGPSPAPLSKIQGRYRWQILLKSLNVQGLANLINVSIKDFSSTSYRKDADLTIQVDVDPASTL